MLGGASGSGALFSVDPISGTETVVHSFAGGTDGANPQGDVITLGTSALFGMAQGGGTAGNGAVYSAGLSTGAEKIVYSFTGGADGAFP